MYINIVFFLFDDLPVKIATTLTIFYVQFVFASYFSHLIHLIHLTCYFIYFYAIVLTYIKKGKVPPRVISDYSLFNIYRVLNSFRMKFLCGTFDYH